MKTTNTIKLMKKVILITALSIFGITGLNAQTSFGVTGGLASISIKVESSFMGSSFSVSDSEIGFYIGGFADFTMSESLHIQPGINYTSVKELSQIYVPIMAKYYFGDIGIYAQAGPQIRYVLEEQAENYTNLGIDLGIGAGYDITEELFVEIRYAFQLNDHYTGSGDASAKYNTLNLGVGYRFN